MGIRILKNQFSYKFSQRKFFFVSFSSSILAFIFSEETGEEGVLKKGGKSPGIRTVAKAGWKSNRQNSSGRSKDSQEITYVPTSALKGAATVQADSVDIEVNICISNS